MAGNVTDELLRKTLKIEKSFDDLMEAREKFDEECRKTEEDFLKDKIPF